MSDEEVAMDDEPRWMVAIFTVQVLNLALQVGLFLVLLKLLEKLA